MSKPEVFISIDIETDGPAPGQNSMLALGAAAFADPEVIASSKQAAHLLFVPESEGKEFDTWYSTMFPLPNAVPNAETMRWWTTQPAAWEIVRQGQFLPDVAIRDFASWVDELPGNPVCVAWPAAFDFSYVNWYCWKYLGRNPLGYSALDIRSYANGLAGHSSYYGLSEAKIRELAGEIDKKGLRPHVAVDDAIEQGRLFFALRNYARKSAA